MRRKTTRRKEDTKKAFFDATIQLDRTSYKIYLLNKIAYKLESNKLNLTAGKSQVS